MRFFYQGRYRPIWGALVQGLPLWVLFCAGLLLGNLLVFSITPAIAVCPDKDKDGYAVCIDCEPGDNQQCGDCDDGNGSIRPNANEICGNQVDENCDGILLLPGGDCGYVTEGICPTASTYVCSADNLSLECADPGTGYDTPEPEESSVPNSCFDDIDNDCDGDIDGEDDGCVPVAELCDGLDNNFNGVIDEGFTYLDATGNAQGLGASCTVGLGVCARTGSVICSENGEAAECSAAPGVAFEELFGIGDRCEDQKDNDCDGLVDVGDPGCQSAELCDGIDNDGNGQVDEGFSNLGQECFDGLGACQQEGVFVCSPNRLTTVCSTTAIPATTEGPTGATCNDNIDNDCDGFTDSSDPDCSSADFALSCAIPYYRLRWWPGFNSCDGVHRLLYSTNVDLEGNPDASLTAELLALDKDGSILDSIPINNWDIAMLASRKDREDWVVDTDGPGTNHKVYSPVPMLRVTLDDGKNKKQAFCSNIPFLQILEPQGKVITASDGDETRLFAITTLIDPSSVEALIDGVDVFSALGISDPETCTPQLPCSGSFVLDDQTINISNIVVQVSSVWKFGQNSVEMFVSNLGCGGHIFQLRGIRLPWSFPNNPDEQCVIDDLADTGDSSGLMIELATPEEGELFESAPVEVTGHACSGRPIAGVNVNGQVFDVSGQTFVEGDGETTGDLYEVQIYTELPETDLSNDINVGDNNLGTVDYGVNRISADVVDDLGNRSFDQSMFAIGNVLSPQVSANIATQIDNELLPIIQTTYAETMNIAATQIDNSFIVGLSEKAVDSVFNNVCQNVAEEFKSRLKANLTARDLGTVVVDPDCSCKVTAPLKISDVSFTGVGSCDATMKDGLIDVLFALPDVQVVIKASRSCKTTFLGACIAKTKVDVTATTKITDPDFSFTITEDQIETSTPPADDMKTFVIGSLRYPGSNGESLENNSDVWTNNSGISCIGADICSFFEGVAGVLVNVFTLGFVDATDVFDYINIEFEMADFENLAGSSEPDPVGISGIKVDKQEVEAFEQGLEGVLSDVEITPSGIVAGLKGSFETLSVDPEITPTMGAVLTPAGLPNQPIPNAGDVLLALADDTFNQFFASMTLAGRLKTACEATGTTLGDLLPPDCSTLSVGACSNDDTVSCKSDADCNGGSCVENALKTIAYKGSCAAFKGQDCNALPLGERIVCNVTATKLEDININASQQLLFCTKQEIPPRLLIQDEPTTEEVETTIRVNDLSVGLVVDRDGNGQLDGDLASTHNCLGEGAPTVGDCSFFSACLDLNLATVMNVASKTCDVDRTIICTSDADCSTVGGSCVEACSNNEPGIVTRVTSLIPTLRASGVVCGGGSVTGDDDLLADTAGEDKTIDLLQNQTTRFTPPACIKGVDLGGQVQFSNPRLISIEADGDPTFGDYLGITGDVD